MQQQHWYANKWRYELRFGGAGDRCGNTGSSSKTTNPSGTCDRCSNAGSSADDPDNKSTSGRCNKSGTGNSRGSSTGDRCDKSGTDSTCTSESNRWPRKRQPGDRGRGRISSAASSKTVFGQRGT